MPGIKELRKRIGTVKNTQQTTKAMKMVSAAKLRRGQDAIHAHRPYARRVGHLLRLVSSMAQTGIVSPLILPEAKKENRDKRLLLIPVTSDRGLCGAFNSNIVKAAQKWTTENSGRYASIRMAYIGRKGADLLKKRYEPAYYSEFGRKATFDVAKKLTRWIIEGYEKGEFDEVHFVYNEFKNAISQKVVVEKFLPVLSDEFEVEAMNPFPTEQEKEDLSGVDRFIVKPSVEEVISRLIEKHFAIQAFRVLLESQASEHGARMSAMDNATRNAGEMIRGLTLLYNKQRQAGITKELLEIIAGSESQKG